MLHLALAAFLAATVAAEPAYFRLELAPSGSQVSIGEPVVKGGMVVFHAYPDGRLMSLRRADVRGYSRVTAKEAAGPPPETLKAIGNLAMQGSSPTSSGRPTTGVKAPAASHGPTIVPTADGLAVTTSNPAALPPN